MIAKYSHLQLSRVRSHARRCKLMLLHRPKRLHAHYLHVASVKRGQKPQWVIACFAVAGLLPLMGLLLAALAAVGFYTYVTQDLPDPVRLAALRLNQSTKIYDRNGELLYEMYDPNEGRRTLIQAEQIPPVLKAAFVATEDGTFDTNPGVDLYGIARAAWQMARYQRVVSGGSTITQQLIKNTLLAPDPTIERKIREAVLALRVTTQYSKPEILAMYLNTTFFGNQAYGIGAAAKAYFGKPVSDLDLAEASLLAGLPQSPLRYDPCKFPAAALSRQNVVLGLMASAGEIDSAQAQSASREMSRYLDSPELSALCNANASLKAPHFVDYVRADLEKRFGADLVYKGGLQVYTTYDPHIQAMVEEEARKQIGKLKDQHVTNAAVVVERVDDGEIYAMLGSVNFNDPSIAGQVNVTDRLRQPGSSIKPINYVTAFKYGWTPATQILDSQTEFPDATGKPYIPINYDERSHGTVTVRTALGSSLNVPAVKALYFTSTKDPRAPAPLAMMETARNMGITTFDNADGSPKPFGLALTLGGGDVKLLELTSVYSVFAREGAVIPTTPYLRVVDGTGRVIYDLHGKDKPQPRCALFDGQAPDEKPDSNGFCAKSAPYAYLITNILSDDRARSIGFGLNSQLKTPYPSAIKTGTTNDFRDNWTMGYTTDWAVGVWVGNDDNSPMIHSTGITGAAPIWRQVMDRIQNSAPGKPFPVPAGIVKDGDEVYVADKPRIKSADTSLEKIAIDTRTGLLAGPGCPKEFVSEVEVDLSQIALGVPTTLSIPKQTSPLCDANADAVNQDGTIGVSFDGTIATGDDGASVWGRVLHANGKPVADLRIAIAGPGDSRIATTSPEGYYNFDELKPNTYSVSANGTGFSVYVPNRRRALVNFTLP